MIVKKANAFPIRFYEKLNQMSHLFIRENWYFLNGIKAPSETGSQNYIGIDI
jgi:hypothetical protein